MIDVLVTLASRSLAKITEISVERLTAKKSRKRPLAVALIELYDATVRLEDASSRAYDLLRQYHDGKAVPLRTKTRSMLDQLVEAIKVFSKRLRDVDSVLEIFDPNLATILLDNGYFGKIKILGTLDVILEAAPQITMSGKFPTNRLAFPTELPDPLLLEIPRNRLNSEKQIEDLKARIARSLKKREIDFTRAVDLQLVLIESENNLRRIRQAREGLADFIRRSVPFTEILSD